MPSAHLLPLLALLSLSSAAPAPAQSTGALGLPDYIAKNLGPYSPYYAAGTYQAPPLLCSVTQVNVLQRHGARFPTSGAGKRINTTITKIQKTANFSAVTDQDYLFLKTYKYALGADSLLPYGAKESSDAGTLAYNRYQRLLTPSSLFNLSTPNANAGKIFVRAGGDQRVVDSAAAWTDAVRKASGGKVSVNDALVIPEGATSNNTIANDDCPASDSVPKDVPATNWSLIYTPSIITRLQSKLPGVNLTALDITNLQSLCAFETVSKQNVSDFCRLFFKEEWENYEYFLDLGKYYGNGYGNKGLGPAQGIGYVNELLARLTNTAVSDYSNTNRTLDSSSSTFPLNQTFYADFSHDNLMASVYSTLGLFNDRPPTSSTNDNNNAVRYPQVDLSSTSRTPSEWIWSTQAPFAGRLVVEKLFCGVGASVAGVTVKVGTEAVRLLVDDKIKTVGGACENREVCELGAFVRSQGYAREGGRADWAKCQA